MANTLRVWRPFQFLAAIDEERPDILHFNGASLWYALLLPILVRRYPVIVTIHDVNPHPGSRAWDQDLARRLFLRYADAVIVHGEWARQQLGASQPCYVIPHGDYSFYAEIGAGEAVAEEDAILFFGRIEPRSLGTCSRRCRSSGPPRRRHGSSSRATALSRRTERPA